MNAELYSELKEEKAIHSGMIPKLDNCFNSLSRGVQKNTNRPPQHVAK
jgi:acetylglutamate kinase